MDRCYAMDTAFYSALGSYEWDVRCEMLAEIGYDAILLTLWSEAAWTTDLQRLGSTRNRHGIDVQSVYVVYDIARAAESETRIAALLRTLEGTSVVELAIRDSRQTAPSVEQTQHIVPLLERLLLIAEAREIDIVIYPHRYFAVERVEQAAALCSILDHPRLGSVFSSLHWYSVDRLDLDSSLRAAAPSLRTINICGLERRWRAERNCEMVEVVPLDAGELDNFAVLAALDRVGYTGPVGIQGFGQWGDPYVNLSRSLRALREMRERARSHPDWGALRRVASTD